MIGWHSSKLTHVPFRLQSRTEVYDHLGPGTCVGAWANDEFTISSLEGHLVLISGLVEDNTVARSPIIAQEMMDSQQVASLKRWVLKISVWSPQLLTNTSWLLLVLWYCKNTTTEVDPTMIRHSASFSVIIPRLCLFIKYSLPIFLSMVDMKYVYYHQQFEIIKLLFNSTQLPW